MLGKLNSYSTDRIAAGDTMTAWAEYLEKIYYGHAVKAGPAGYISGSIEKRDFADVGISRHVANAHQISRTPALIASDNVEKHAFVFVTSGVLECEQGGSEIVVEQGRMYVLNASEPFKVRTSDNSSTMCITLPSVVSRQAIRALDEKICKAYSGEPLLIDTGNYLIGRLFNAQSAVDGLWLRNIVCSLLDAMLNPRYGGSPSGTWRTSEAARGLLINAMRQVIIECLHRQDFNVNQAAQACRVSPRHLQSVLTSVGSTFTDDLLEARLSRARNMLRSPLRGTKLIAEIARDCGFKTQAHFSTRYKERFGISPKDERSDIIT